MALVVANPGVIDTRIIKHASALAESGYEVLVLCHSPDEERQVRELYGVRFVQLPVHHASAGGLATQLRHQAARAGRLARRRIDGPLARFVPGHEGSGMGGPLRRAELAAYRRLPRLASWRSVCRTSVAMQPLLWAELDAFDPDLVHQHDVHELNATASWVTRRRAAGRQVVFLYDAREYVIGQPNPPARQVAAFASMEREFIRLADQVTTVSEPIADQLSRQYDLRRHPVVVLNATWTADDTHSGTPSGGTTVRQAAGVADNVPLVVYIGGLAPPRGVHTVVEALAHLPEVHLAIISRAESSYTRTLRRLATQRGLQSRMHVVPFVEPHQVVAYLAGCDLGISPLLHAPNHDWALTNKFFEYIQAGIPVITSDTPVQRDIVRANSLGTVFRAGDVGECARAIRMALDDLSTFRAAVRNPRLQECLGWQEQSRVLIGLYDQLLSEEGRDGQVI